MKFTKTLAAITAAAMAVTMAAIPASAVESEMATSGVKVIDKSDANDGTNCLKLQTPATGGALEVNATDVIKATISGDEGVDTSAWQIGLNAFDSAWGGWAGVWTEPGVLEVETTVQALMDAISCTDVANFGGFLFQAVGTEDGANVNYTFSIAPAAAETPDDDTTGDDTTEDDNTVGDTEEAPGESTEVPEEPAAPADVALDNAGTITMDGGWRVNLVHPWAGEENKEAFNIVDATKFANSNTISVKFKATNVTAPFTAWLSFATNDDTGLAYWGADNAANAGVTHTPITIDKDGYYVLTLTTDKLITVGENFFLALQTDNKDEESELAIELVAVKAGEALEVTEDDVIDVPGGESGTNPPTGVTLVVVPAALAAAALATSGIVLKKRSK
ncbi:MAG: hypothetical protein IJF09_05390 [Ruminiclostridium sp.]|nr:hypothetical protein [Ruminiclostridium sp.]